MLYGQTPQVEPAEFETDKSWPLENGPVNRGPAGPQPANREPAGSQPANREPAEGVHACRASPDASLLPV